MIGDQGIRSRKPIRDCELCRESHYGDECPWVELEHLEARREFTETQTRLRAEYIRLQREYEDPRIAETFRKHAWPQRLMSWMEL